MKNVGNRIKECRMALGLQQGEFTDKLGIANQQQLSNYERGVNKPNADFFNSVAKNKELNINVAWLLTGEGNMLNSGVSSSVGGTYFIPYWDENPISAEKLKKPGIDKGLWFDIEIITKEWGCVPKNTRLISTPGEDMDGGQYPIRNKDLLVIDISKNEVTDSGNYLITTNGGKIVMLRRLMELADGSVAFYVDNEKYAFAINKTYSAEDLKAMDFKVIGRVVKNVTYTL